MFPIHNKVLIISIAFSRKEEYMKTMIFVFEFLFSQFLSHR